MAAKTTLIIFVGGIGDSGAEQMVAGAHRAISLDILERARASGTFSQAIVVTDMGELAEEIGELARVEFDQSPFHFGKRLQRIISKYHIQNPLYLGGGSAPLLSVENLGDIARQLSSSTHTLITNNIFSADLIGFTPGKAIEAVDLPARDNPLAQLLHHQAGLRVVCLPRTAATLFDVDTPADLLVLKLHPATGPHTHRYLKSLQLDLSRLLEAVKFLADPTAEVLVAGRVSSYVWAQLEKETACRVRVLSEERGMSADGREDRGEVYSILGFWLEEVGATRFFDTLSRLGDAAFIDTRVIFQHLGLNLSASDRFYSDLGEVDKIRNPLARRFTQSAIEAPIPVVLGGHSLVSGGLLALIEAAHGGKSVKSASY